MAENGNQVCSDLKNKRQKCQKVYIGIIIIMNLYKTIFNLCMTTRKYNCYHKQTEKNHLQL